MCEHLHVWLIVFDFVLQGEIKLNMSIIHDDFFYFHSYSFTLNTLHCASPLYWFNRLSSVYERPLCMDVFCFWLTKFSAIHYTCTYSLDKLCTDRQIWASLLMWDFLQRLELQRSGSGWWFDDQASWSVTFEELMVDSSVWNPKANSVWFGLLAFIK